MLRLNLNRITHQKGIERPFTALRQLKISHRMATYYLKGQYKTLKLNDIEKICMAWHCTPNDLLQWVQGPNDIDLPTAHPPHPLNELYHPDVVPNVSALMKVATPEKLKEIHKILMEGWTK